MTEMMVRKMSRERRVHSDDSVTGETCLSLVRAKGGKMNAKGSLSLSKESFTGHPALLLNINVSTSVDVALAIAVEGAEMYFSSPLSSETQTK
jgi:hypothetical protein